MEPHTKVNATSKESSNRALDVTRLWTKVALVTFQQGTDVCDDVWSFHSAQYMQVTLLVFLFEFLWKVDRQRKKSSAVIMFIVLGRSFEAFFTKYGVKSAVATASVKPSAHPPPVCPCLYDLVSATVPVVRFL